MRVHDSAGSPAVPAGRSSRRTPRHDASVRACRAGQRYNPNADEALLNKAYVYAMQKHGTQKRASGDPYFSHPLEVAAILTDLKLDDATIAVALLHDTIEDTDATRAEIDAAVRRGDRPAGRGPDQDQASSTSSRRRRSRRRTCASCCSPSPTTCACCWSSSPTGCTTCARSSTCRRKRGGASPRRRWRSMRRSPAAWACRTCARSWRSSPSATSTRRPMRPSPQRLAEHRASATASLIARIENELTERFGAQRHQGRGDGAARRGPSRSSARWSARRSPSSSSPTSSASA